MAEFRGCFPSARTPLQTTIIPARHLLGQPHVTIEGREVVERVLSSCDSGIDFADALHHASYKFCENVATFDDRNFARKARKLGMTPAVKILS